MTTLERREKCLGNRSEKGHLRALRAHQTRNRPLPGGFGSSVNQNWLKRCRARPVGLFNEFDRRVKTEIPDKLSYSTWYKKSVRSGSFGSLGMDPQRSHPLLSSITKEGYER